MGALSHSLLYQTSFIEVAVSPSVSPRPNSPPRVLAVLKAQNPHGCSVEASSDCLLVEDWWRVCHPSSLVIERRRARTMVEVLAWTSPLNDQEVALAPAPQ